MAGDRTLSGPPVTEYETVIGLEVHVELKTESKMFCHCPTTFGAEPNTQVCPVCLGLPGVLPVVNRKAIEYAVMVSLALNCEIAPYSKFDRKNYFYPDLPKGYQISQYDLPLARRGYLDLEVNGRRKRIGIRRVHMEEDTGKLFHPEDGAEYSLVDLNRAGVPLLEIVSEPDIRSPEEARLYLTRLKAIIQYTGVSDVKMEEGSLRCDANVSLRPRGSEEYGTMTEIKNLNSFRSVQKALEYEVERHRRILEDGGRVVRETRGWVEGRGITVPLRGKEEAQDYRYFPEPDLVPLVLDREWVEEIRRRLPELPDQRRRRFVEEYGLPEYDAGVLTASRDLADFYEETVRLFPQPKVVSNWVMGDLMAYLNTRNLEIRKLPVTPASLARMLRMIEEGTISGKIAKTVLEEMCATGQEPEAVVREKGLVQITDEAEIAALADRVISENPSVAEDYRKGKDKAIGFLVGQVMKYSQGRANPALVNRLLREKLGR